MNSVSDDVSNDRSRPALEFGLIGLVGLSLGVGNGVTDNDLLLTALIGEPMQLNIIFQ